MNSDIPLFFTAGYPEFESILSIGKILSKKQLTELKIPFKQHTTSYGKLEQVLGTFNDVTLFIDPLFRSGVYGGFLDLGPRMLFDRQILYEDGVYMLPHDQSGYFNSLEERPTEIFQNFEKDKMISPEEIDKFIQSMDIGSVVNVEDPLEFRRTLPCPEVHVPREIAIDWIKGVMIHTRYIDEYEKRSELDGKIIVPFLPKKNSSVDLLSPDSISLLNAYKNYLQKIYS